jgi:hypothetical protein
MTANEWAINGSLGFLYLELPGYGLLTTSAIADTVWRWLAGFFGPDFWWEEWSETWDVAFKRAGEEGER